MRTLTVTERSRARRSTLVIVEGVTLARLLDDLTAHRPEDLRAS